MLIEFPDSGLAVATIASPPSPSTTLAGDNRDRLARGHVYLATRSGTWARRSRLAKTSAGVKSA